MSIRAEIQIYIDKVLGEHKEELGARLARMRHDQGDIKSEIARVKKNGDEAEAQVKQQILELTEQDVLLKKELAMAVAGEKKHSTKLFVIVGLVLIVLLAYVNFVNWQNSASGLEALRTENRNAVESLRQQSLSAVELVCMPTCTFEDNAFHGYHPKGEKVQLRFRWKKSLMAAPTGVFISSISWTKGQGFAEAVPCAISSFDSAGVTLVIQADNPAPDLKVTVVALIKRREISRVPESGPAAK